MAKIKLMHGDCLDRMTDIEDGSVSLIMCDLPYGTTGNKWDSIIDLPQLWTHYRRLVGDTGTIVLTASQPFTSILVASNLKMFRYAWVWKKSRFANQMLAKVQPLKIHEDVLVFSKARSVYNAQGLVEVNKVTKQGTRVTDNLGGGKRGTSYVQTHTNYPRSIIEFGSAGKTVHPTQKPVDLMAYMIRTYTSEGQMVLDNTMGSGTTGVAAIQTNRNFIGIERDREYFKIAASRIREAVDAVNRPQPKKLFKRRRP